MNGVIKLTKQHLPSRLRIINVERKNKNFKLGRIMTSMSKVGRRNSFVIPTKAILCKLLFPFHFKATNKWQQRYTTRITSSRQQQKRS